MFANDEEQQNWMALMEGSESAIEFFYQAYQAQVQDYIRLKYVEKKVDNLLLATSSQYKHPELNRRGKAFIKEVTVETFCELKRHGKQIVKNARFQFKTVLSLLYDCADRMADKTVWKLYQQEKEGKSGQKLLNYFCEKYHEAVFRQVSSVRFNSEPFNDELKREVCQDVFIKIYRGLDSFRWNDDKATKLGTWIHTIVKNHCLDVIAKLEGDGAVILVSIDDDLKDETLITQPVEPYKAYEQPEKAREKVQKYVLCEQTGEQVLHCSPQQLSVVACCLNCLEQGVEAKILSPDCIPVILAKIMGWNQEIKEAIAPKLTNNGRLPNGRAPGALEVFVSTQCFVTIRNNPNCMQCFEACCSRA